MAHGRPLAALAPHGRMSVWRRWACAEGVIHGPADGVLPHAEAPGGHHISPGEFSQAVAGRRGRWPHHGRTGTAPRPDQTRRLQLRVSAQDRSGRDSDVAGELSHRGQTGSRRDLSRGDGEGDLASHLLAGRCGRWRCRPRRPVSVAPARRAVWGRQRPGAPSRSPLDPPARGHEDAHEADEATRERSEPQHAHQERRRSPELGVARCAGVESRDGDRKHLARVVATANPAAASALSAVCRRDTCPAHRRSGRRRPRACGRWR